MRALLHFVGFRDAKEAQRYWNAARIWGPPDYVHETWDIYAANDVAPGDIVVFATDAWDRQPRSFSQKAHRRREAERNRRAPILE